jgi:hypothetical protein
MSKYAELDAKIMQTIARGKAAFALIHPACLSLSFDLSRGTSTEPWRIVDRRLQALRKAGKIIFGNGQWAIKFKDEEL